MADVVAQPGDDPNCARSQYIRAMREVKALRKAGRIDEHLRVHAANEEAARIAAAYPTQYAEVQADIRQQTLDAGLLDPPEPHTQE